MRLRNILLFITLLIFTTTVFANTNPVVTNVAFTIDGTTVTVTYDVADAEEDAFTVYMEVSEDGGTTWDFNYGVTTGDIGEGIAEGTGKAITWQYSGGNAGTMKIKILADDIFGDQIYYSYQIYNIVTIGSQVWLKENLNVGTKIISDGSHTGTQQTNNSTIEKYCYSNNESNCDIYGGLYEWGEAIQYENGASNTTSPSPALSGNVQGICPSGWHIPTEPELQMLKISASSNATKLIDESQMMSGYTPTNETGFSALFTGDRKYNNGNFFSAGLTSFFWSSTEFSSSNTVYMYLNYNASDIYFSNYHKKNDGFSVRCIKN